VLPGEWATVDKGAAIWNPIEDRWLVVVLHRIGGIRVGHKSRARLRCARWRSSVRTKHLFHREQRLLDDILWHLLACKPSCKYGHLISYGI
jgi:hypothetical protein